MKKATHSEEQSRPRKAKYSTAMSSPVLQSLAVLVVLFALFALLARECAI